MLNHKRGDTFDVSGVVTVEAGSTDMSLWTPKAQLRLSNPTRTLIQELTCEFLSPTEGLLNIRATATQTEKWPLGLALIDLRFVQGDVVVSSPTFQLTIIEDITHG